MRNNFLEEFYHGNLAPQSTSDSKDVEFKSAWNTVAKNEEILTKLLTDEELRIFREYVSAYGRAFTVNDREAFIRGFKIGARLIFDTFDDVEELMFI